MKNIHILPTDKPSRLIIQNGNRLILGVLDYSIIENRQHIYITSDEEIKKGDWFITTDTNEIHKSDWVKFHFNNGKKIILTTNVGLIKNGVQKIDDEFLEWFVKNPSCERVEIEKYCRNGLCDSRSRSKTYKMDEHRHEDPKDKCWYSGCQCPGKRLTIPEEIQPQQIWNEEKMEGVKNLIQKQKLIDMMEQDEQLGLYEETKCYCGHTTTCDCGPEQDFKNIELPQQERQETLEEFIDKELYNGNITDDVAEGIRFGAKWQQERSYSEEDLKESWYNGMKSDNGFFGSFEEWFEQFKKK